MGLWRTVALSLAGLVLLTVGCQEPVVVLSVTTEGLADPNGSPFVAFMLIERTFTEGTSVVTQRYHPQNGDHDPIDIDFNGDGRADPVVGYGGETAVVQILLTQSGLPAGSFLSLTLDRLRDMEDLSDLAVGDINNDGSFDIIGGASTGVWYLRHPLAPQTTTDLRYWDITPIDASTVLVQLDEASILAMVDEHLPPGATLNDYDIEVDSRFINVEVADLNLDGHSDIVAARFLMVTLTPVNEGGTLEVIEIVQGDISLFFNPGDAADGTGWPLTTIGQPEWVDPAGRFDREGVNGLIVVDMDRDGDLDIVSAAQTDNNVQVAWFENPGPLVIATDEWVQWRIGSVRDVTDIDIADLTGDGLPDVVATGRLSQQVFLFVQPSTGAKREYDWDTYVVATFESYTPGHIKIVDYDVDGVRELVVGASKGAIRRFDPGPDPTVLWTASTVMSFGVNGDIGSIGPADVDGDGDPDFIVVIDASSDNDEFVAYIRNDT